MKELIKIEKRLFHLQTPLELLIFTVLELPRQNTQTYSASVELKKKNTLREAKEVVAVAEEAVVAEVAAEAEEEIVEIVEIMVAEAPEEAVPSLLTTRKLSPLSER